MKTQTLLVTIAMLATFSGAALAGPDFYLIERGRAAKQAEQLKQSADAKKCFSNEVVAANTSK